MKQIQLTSLAVLSTPDALTECLVFQRVITLHVVEDRKEMIFLVQVQHVVGWGVGGMQTVYEQVEYAR